MIRCTILAVLFALTTPFALLAKQETRDIPFRFKNADSVVFNHDVHLKKYNNCKICHDAIFDLKNPRHYTMVEMEKTKSCGACHAGVKAFSVAEDKNCVRCHKGIPRDIAYKVKGATDAVFSHTFHSGVYRCNDCHTKLFQLKTGAKRYTIGEKPCCGACHNGKVAFSSDSCQKCHPGYKQP